jgi:hypothetical protein
VTAPEHIVNQILAIALHAAGVRKKGKGKRKAKKK